MCLTTVQSTTKEEIEGEGWKIISVEGLNCFKFPIIPHIIWDYDSWIERSQTLTNNLMSDDGVIYPIGFHIFLTKEDAKVYLKLFKVYLKLFNPGSGGVYRITKVKFKTILARGTQDVTSNAARLLDVGRHKRHSKSPSDPGPILTPCIIAEFILVPKVPRDISYLDISPMKYPPGYIPHAHTPIPCPTPNCGRYTETYIKEQEKADVVWKQHLEHIAQIESKTPSTSPEPRLTPNPPQSTPKKKRGLKQILERLANALM